MDVFVAEDDNLVSLEEALAFIDGFDQLDQSLTDTLVGDVDLFSLTPSPESLTPKAVKAPVPIATKKRSKPQRKLSESSSNQDENPTKKRRTRSAASSSTRLQQRKRAEIQALREQAQELEAQVELLKKNKFLPGDVVLELDSQLSTDGDGALVMNASTQKPPSNWHEMAITQYKERLVSEKTNRRLKSILSNQEKVNGALSGLLQKRSVLNGMDYVLSAQTGVEASLIASRGSANEELGDKNKTIVTELEELVQSLYEKSQSKFTATTQSPAITCDMRIKHDAKRGKMVEFITTTPMSCNVDEASEILWKEMTTYRDYPDKTYKYMKASKPNTHEKHFVMNLRSPSGIIELNGLQFMQRFDEEDRTVFVAAERMVLPTKSCQFQDECWMTVTPSETGRNTSVVDISLHLYMEPDDGLDTSTDDVAYAQNIVLGSLSNTFRKFFQAQQNMLMEKAGRVSIASSTAPGIVV